MSRKIKRTIALLLALIMVISLVSVVVNADEVDVIESKSTDNNTKVGLVGTFNQWKNEEMSLTSSNEFAITVELQAGTYEFKITENGYWMGYGDKFTDTTSNIILSSTKGRCIIIATGGTYMFKYNAETNKLTVRRLSGPNKKVHLSGDFNIWAVYENESLMTEESQDMFSKTIELVAGTYQFKIVEDGVWLGNEGIIYNTTQNISPDGFNLDEDSGNCFLNADGGIYTFKYNAITDKIIVIWNQEMPESSSATVETESSEPSSQITSSSKETDATEPSSRETDATEPASGETEKKEHSCEDEKTLETIIQPNCEEPGKVEYTCNQCGARIIEKIRATGHKFSDKYIVDRKPTCIKEGIKSKHCINCDAVSDVVKIQPIGENGHTIVIDKAVSPSCSKGGLTKGSHCSECKMEIVSQKKVKKTPHKNEKKVISYLANGYKYTTTCKVCKKVISKGVVYIKVKIPSFTAQGGKNKIFVKYKKVSGAKGFQIKYLNGQKAVVKTYNLNKTSKRVLKNIKKGTYKVYVRTFTKQRGKRYYSSWTKAKKVKVK